jgi:tetratricopeptide (TPR) repeat protein
MKPLLPFHAVCSTLLLALASGAVAQATGPAQSRRAASSARPLAWRDTDGHAYGGADLKQAPATVFVFGSTTCPCADRYNGRVAELAAELAPRGARFFQVFSGEEAEREAVRRYVASRKITLPVVTDRSRALAARFGAKVTPTAVVLGSDGRVRYRGRIDDNPDPQAVVRQDLRLVVEALLRKAPVPVRETRAIGCTLGGSKAPASARPKLVSGIGAMTFPITTRSAEAQRYFNQGVNRWFGFNFPEAEVSFREAARLDPECAMAQWGIALSLGMTYNMDFTPERLPEAEQAVQKAVALAQKATPKERALIEALAVRHSPGKDMLAQLQPYHEAMSTVYLTYPEDVNVAVLYAASGMDLRPWALWTRDERPAPGTLEILLVLEDALRRDPNHIGANHYYIHATEASPFPERALQCTGRLAAQAPESGHLVHMPAHTFLRVGDYTSSAQANRRAAAVDSAYFTGTGKSTGYAGYYAHNLDFIVASLMFSGRSKEAIQASRDLAREAGRWAPEVAGVMCGGGSGLMTVYARFGKWDEILRAPAPLPENLFGGITWRYARGRALAARKDFAGAEKELAALIELEPAVAQIAEQIPLPGLGAGLVQATRTARLHLAGKIAASGGKTEEAIRLYREAVEAEDAIPYLEPPLWRHPVRETLGALLIQQGKPAEAETLFREELKLHRRSGRALFGLAECLERQGKRDEAAAVRREMDEAWSKADVKLTLAEL